MKINIIILCIFIFTSCENIGDYHYPAKPYFDKSMNLSVPDDLGVEAENDFSNIVIKIKQEPYNSENEEIIYTVKNLNPNKGFWKYTATQVEYLKNNEWVQIPFNGREHIDYGWLFHCGKTQDDLVEVECVLKASDLAKEFIINENKFMTGKYQVIVFIGDSIQYIGFEITSNHRINNHSA